ncbi:MAG: hypothetical protein G5701_03925 [Serratia symbiotica]|nr:hypothetical protein [Serratia symbiotica]
MLNKDIKPFSLRARFLMATAGVILALSLSYGLVAVVCGGSGLYRQF